MALRPEYPETLFARLLAAVPAERRGRPALEFADSVWSYEDLTEAVLRSARLLHGAGLRRGDRVLLLLPNSPEYIVAFLATTAIGAVAVPVEIGSGVERLRFIASDTGPLFCLRAPDDRRLPGDFPIRQFEFRLDAPPGGPRMNPEPGSPIRSVGTSSATPPTSVELGVEPITEDTDAVILFSAGSTGVPKGAVLRHGQLLAIAETLIGIIRMGPDHRDLIISPLTHSGAFQRVTATLLAGGCAVIAQGGLSVTALLDDVKERRIRGFFAPPPVLRVLLMSPEERVREAMAGLESIESASAPLSAAELARLLALLPNVRVYFQYGLTECSRAFILDTRARPDKLHTVGTATAGVEVAIAAADGRLVGPGERGEILLSAPQRTDRYWNRPDLDRERFRGCWLATGDVGSVDGEGFLTFHGRQDDLINCGGLSYFPAEVEREIGAVQGVSQLLIAGVQDPQGILGQVPWAFVVPADPSGWTPREFAARCRDRLPPHMVPRRVVVVPSIPLVGSGKPNRRLLIEQHGQAASRKPIDEQV